MTMMTTAFRIGWLFVAYAAVGYGGEWAVGLLARDAPGHEVVQAAESPVAESPVADVAVRVRPEVVVRVRPVVATSVQVRHGADCSYETEREVTIPATSDDALSIRAGAGDLRVEGRDDLDEVVVVGQLCASSEEYLDALDVRAERSSGGEVLLETEYPDARRWSGDGHDEARIDLTVLLPRGMAVRIDDSSGGIVVNGSGDLVIDDSSGDIEVEGVDGTVRIDDSSGGVDLRDVTGDVEIDDSSGGLDLRGIGGSLTVSDGSGGIDVARVDGDVRVRSDGSGGRVESATAVWTGV